MKPEGVGGGREQSSSISRFPGNSGALSTLKQIVHILSYLERLLHSVISNSVLKCHDSETAVSLIVPDLQFLCTAVHVISSFSTSLLLLCFLFLLICIPRAGWNAKKYIEKEKKREWDKLRQLHELPAVHRNDKIWDYHTQERTSISGS